MDKIPVDDYYCPRCDAGAAVVTTQMRNGDKKTSVKYDGEQTRAERCQLCPNTGGYLVEVAESNSKLWVHLMCVRSARLAYWETCVGAKKQKKALVQWRASERASERDGRNGIDWNGMEWNGKTETDRPTRLVHGGHLWLN